MQEKNARQELLRELEETNEKIPLLELRISDEIKLIKEANQRKADAESMLQKMNRAVCRIKELLIVNNGLTNGLKGLRQKIIMKMQKFTRKDITVAKKELLEKEINKLKRILQKACPHTFVLSYDGYSGSHGYDYDDGYFGQRQCVVCDFNEYSKSKSRDIYEVLSENETRLVKRDLRYYDRPVLTNENEVWQNFDFFLKMFEKSAGNMNAKW